MVLLMLELPAAFKCHLGYNSITIILLGMRFALNHKNHEPLELWFKKKHENFNFKTISKNCKWQNLRNFANEIFAEKWLHQWQHLWSSNFIQKSKCIAIAFLTSLYCLKFERGHEGLAAKNDTMYILCKKSDTLYIN